MTEAGSIIGTAQYLSPEQARGAPVDQRSDIYSVGVLLYELLTGAVPFTGDTPVEIAMKHLSAVPEQPSKKRPDVPRGLDLAVVRALAKDPEDRFQSAEEMDAELARIEQGFRVSDETADAATAVLAGAGIDSTAVRKAPVVTTGAYRPPPGVPAAVRRRPKWPWLLAALLLIGAGVGAVLVDYVSHQAEAEHPRPGALRRGDRRAARQAEARRPWAFAGRWCASSTPTSRRGQRDPPEPGRRRADPEGQQGDHRRLEGAAQVTVPNVVGMSQIGGRGLTFVQRLAGRRAHGPERPAGGDGGGPEPARRTSWSTCRPCPDQHRDWPAAGRRARRGRPVVLDALRASEPRLRRRAARTCSRTSRRRPSSTSALGEQRRPQGIDGDAQGLQGAYDHRRSGRHRPRPGHGDGDAALGRLPGGGAAQRHDRSRRRTASFSTQNPRGGKQATVGSTVTILVGVLMPTRRRRRRRRQRRRPPTRRPR